MAYSLITLLLLAPITFALWNLHCLYRNYQLAKKMGVPIVIIFASGDNPIWHFTSGFILPTIKLIFGDIELVKYGAPGWENRTRYKIHEDYGDAVMHVSPGYNWLYLADADAINEVCRRSKDFDRPPDLLAMLDIFGPNISTAVGADWQRQRKVTSAPFNDRNNRLVWSQSLKQTEEALQFWKSLDGPIHRTFQDLRTISLHVLSGAAFGKSYSFHGATEPPQKGHMFNYRYSINLILENALLILILGPKFLSKVFWPTSWAKIGQATIDFKFLMTEMLQEERTAIAQGKTRDATFTNSLLRASEELSGNSKVANGGDKMITRGLTEEEIYGNIFVYNFAGHDTTSGTLSWILYLLAAYPEVQEWIAEELKSVFGDDEIQSQEFEKVYPKLIRCTAVLYESLRLWNPLLGIVKSTFDTPQPLEVRGKKYMVPPNTRIIPNFYAIHTLPRYWGSDSLSWNPKRWVLKSVDSLNESLKVPQKGSYIPWGDGIRTCPGKKFAQVTVVAVLAGLFRKHRVKIVQKEDENVKQAKQRVKDVVDDNGVVLLFQMKNPESVGLSWVEI